MPPPRPPPEPKKKARFHVIFLLIAISGILFLHELIDNPAVQKLEYSEFVAALADKRVENTVISADELQGVLVDPATGDKTNFVTTRVDLRLAEELTKAGVKFRAEPTSALVVILSWIGPVIFFVLLWMLMTRQMGGKGAAGFMNIGKSKARVYVESDTKVTFADVAGVDEAKDELKEIVDFLKDPVSHGRLGGRMPRGVMLVGPPGTGKTLLARAVAGEAGVPFFSISGSEFVEMFVGVGAARVRDLFEQAKEKAPAIIFIDELDALGKARGAGPMYGGHDEKEQTLNQLLVELDGFDPRAGIVLIAATNRPEILDPALLRAGRFDRQVLVDRPDQRGRVQILEVHLKKVKIAAGVSMEQVAALTPGFTGADLANLCNEAALVATRRKGESVELNDFTLAVERIVAGLEKRNRILNARERNIVAHHEMGHAIVAAATPGSDPVHKVSVIPRGIGALGYTMQRPTEDRFLMTREELENKMAVLLGGRAAEHLVWGHFSTGASDDLERATRIARSMVARYGMTELGHVSYDEDIGHFLQQANPFAPRSDKSDATAREIDVAVRGLVETAFHRARAVLKRHQAVLIDAAKQLLAKETLVEAELKVFFERLKGGEAGAGAAAEVPAG
ncbi:MAG: ATP-dependent metallopeptidase FtsH/Yme1/Tma family protein [Planctomycetes bacterium]|nr:ATP-dependent metallopeptidase FtsH/Yme1/Tma family protein [Planctomycetota bacterium]